MAVLGVILFAVMGLTTEIVVGWNEGERQEILENYRTTSYKGEPAVLKQGKSDNDYVSKDDFDKAISTLMSAMDSLTIDMHKLRDKTDVLDDAVFQDLKPEVTQLTKNYNSGTIRTCTTGQINGCSPNCQNLEATTKKDITYGATFHKTPFLIVSLVRFDDVSNTPVRYKIFTENNSPTGFTLGFQVFRNSRAGYADIRWLACA